MSIPGKKYGMEVGLKDSIEGHYERLLVMMRIALEKENRKMVTYG